MTTCNPYHEFATQHSQWSTTTRNLQPISRICNLAQPTIHDHKAQPPTTQHHRAQPPATHIANSRSTTHDPQLKQCEYEHVMERMSFGFYWSRVLKFRIFCLWVLLIDAFLVDLWSFGCLSWWLLLDYFTTSPEMKALAEVTEESWKMRERREMGEKIYNFEIYYFIM